MTPLEKELKVALLAIYYQSGTIVGYWPRYYKRMLTSSDPRFYRGPVGTVEHLMLGEAGPTFQRFVKAGKVTLTVEWLIANDDKFHPLFEKCDWVIKKAQSRVREILD